MIRVGDADIRRRLRRNIRNNVVVNFSVIRVQLQIDRNIRVECLKIRDRFFVNIRLVSFFAQNVISYCFVVSKLSGTSNAALSFEP